MECEGVDWIRLDRVCEEGNELSVSVEGKVVPVFLTEHHAMKAYWGSGGIAPLILWPRH
jgi:hypothetical protein